MAVVDATPVFTPVHGDFRYLANYMRFYGVYGKVDGILADLGVSSHHAVVDGAVAWGPVLKAQN